ncbi:sulfate ABC transporter ATP-binding protein [Hyphomicrobium sp. LHD-15]|uniref:sulfate/molybdate ABC transporter ATP-binding protein n=1 Tax=Hyphomicrobium sp. LHD-15 TaxID=3072142 RepID=UPI00280CF710|nr:sulfate ABC transporter ATP-binding protein [Hyphomicrobium sp. LHD-15]MDQ8698094.1 sulfate ABC transporter ATP-binding protein [Hyphomicrobium sp. LHD-15]
MSIEVKNISKSFGSFKALNNINLDLPPGELIALLGPSGCGKTTLLRIIAGLETADEGSIILSGEDASNKHVRERQVGFVFQHYALFRHMTVFENVAFGLRVKPKAHRPPEKEIRAKVHRLLDLVQLDWLADRFPAQLSGGQRQRIALARALAVEPQVLLLDEPFGALDAKVRKELRRWLRRLHDELHISSVFVTHDQEEALEVSDRIVLMNKGRIEQIGSPREIYNEPATSFAYSFIGTVNEFRGHVEGGYVRVGNDLLPHNRTDLNDGASVIAFARPHDTEIIKGAEGEGVAAKVNRILSSGAITRVELIANGDARQGKKDYFEVEVTPADLAALSLATGEAVRIKSRRLSLFGDK